MKLICWDTSSKTGALAAIEWDGAGKSGWQGVKLVGEWMLNVDATHSERLLWAIHQLLETAGWKLADIDCFGIGIGPGSFTGLRIGLTTARTLAHSCGKPLVPVSSLAALARPAAEWLAVFSRASDSLGRTVIVASTDACKGELFSLWGSARSIADCVVMSDGDSPGLWKRGVDEKVLSPDQLIDSVKKKLSQSEDARWLPLGEGRFRYPEAWKKLPASKRLDPPCPFPDHVQGRHLARLAWEGFQAGLAREALSVHPRYLRASDAELKLKAGLLPAGPTRFDS